MNWYAYVHGDPVNGTDPTGTDADDYYPNGIINGPVFDTSELTVTKYLTPYSAQNSNYNGGNTGGAPRTPGDGGGGNGRMPQNVTSVVVVTGRKKVQLVSVLPPFLLDHFFVGGGSTVCLTGSQFAQLAKVGKPVSTRPLANGLSAQTTNYYGTAYQNSFGTATLILNSAGSAVGFFDGYDFNTNPGQTRSPGAQALTNVGHFFEQNGAGTDFDTEYGGGDCQ